MIRSGTDSAVAMKITGHKTESMFRRYNIVSTEDMEAAMAKRSDYENAQPAESNVAEFKKG